MRNSTNQERRVALEEFLKNTIRLWRSRTNRTSARVTTSHGRGNPLAAAKTAPYRLIDHHVEGRVFNCSNHIHQRMNVPIDRSVSPQFWIDNSTYRSSSSWFVHRFDSKVIEPPLGTACVVRNASLRPIQGVWRFGRGQNLFGQPNGAISYLSIDWAREGPHRLRSATTPHTPATVSRSQAGTHKYNSKTNKYQLKHERNERIEKERGEK